MATLPFVLRIGNRLLRRTALCRCQHAFRRPISTSDKSKDLPSIAVNEPMIERADELKRLEEHFADTDPNKLKNWQSHGWSDFDYDADKFHHILTMLGLFTLCLVPASFLVMYNPDFKLRDWAMREAYLEIDRREKNGLPLIDPYYVPPGNVRLPTEQEIGDREIII
ncbi:NADH dehydrogenase [ubiquinone] 1 beta subcomplex subunit 11, mitochondrial-like [Dreissena polymorpha]|uniref:NADH dehydrogenase [ubiquinone] 1 beta subcomplex subunit 11, mitochondrial n=1 Tax=Dreissena polymorpha TaxID=45954 RepID=A0A9D4S814_DREPO|nr:NADH dehydrogenase [ubiquinone] 1 beta subcomplex subunit 11, mitochondrial-like [Dreissena polymorpha]KAH3893162.1 hypothetical protein DPMN_017305 [Dreissena polymorpha]